MLFINYSANSLSALILLLCFTVSFSDKDTAKKALLSFKADSDPTHSLSSWLNSSDPCSGLWLGVFCDSVTGRVTKLVLEHLGLAGSVHPLTQLADLRHLSLKNNSLGLAGSSVDLSAWPNLKHLYLSHNRFAGSFPAGVSTLRRLQRLDLSYNGFYGGIPVAELARLPRLLTLRLESNRFDGGLGESNLSVVSPVSDFNVSGNSLSGEIPEWLRRFNATAFGGNHNLCGKPLPSDNQKDHCSSYSTTTPAPSPQPETNVKQSTHSATAVLVLIAAIAAAAISTVAMAAVLVWCLWRRRTRGGRGASSKGNGSHAMVMFEGCRKGMVEGSVDELLRGSAEMLGKGGVGSTYKVVVDGEEPVVVKRADKAARLGKEVDWWLRQVLGKLRHDNIASLRAYHRSENNDLLLLVYDYFPTGSLHHLLHGGGGSRVPPLDWATRLKLASDSARGLSFLHDRNMRIRLFHGKFSSTNVLVDQSGNACIADVGLHQLLCGTEPPRTGDYTAPEMTGASPRKYTQKCDVYSFGVVLLELLTGKMAAEEGEMSLVGWVRRAWASGSWDVLDVGILLNGESEEGISALMQVAMLCLAPLPKDRPVMSVVYRMIEDIRQGLTEPSE